MANRTTTCLHPGTRQNKFIVQQLQLKNTSTNGKQDMAIAVNGSRPASYIGHVVSNGTNFNLPVGAVSVNVGMNLTNLNLKLALSRPMPWVGAQRILQAVESHNRSPRICTRTLRHLRSHHPAVARHRLRRLRYLSNRWSVGLERRIRRIRRDSRYPLFSPTSLLYFFAFVCYDVGVITFFLLLIQFVYCSNDLFGTRRTHARRYPIVGLLVYKGMHAEILTYNLPFFAWEAPDVDAPPCCNESETRPWKLMAVRRR